MKSLYLDIKSLLTERQMDEGEAKAIALLLLEKVCGMTTTEVLMNAPKGEAHRQVLIQMAERVAKGEPVQYVLGEADFCGMSIKVRPGVLIPRKETEELVNWIVESLHPNHQLSTVNCQLSTVNCQLSTVNCQLLDIGTGSGCIAVALAKRLENAEVEAWDVSEVALQVAKENAKRHGVRVEVNKVDVLSTLNPQPSTLNRYNVIVSNPPYICEEEKEEMERNVLEHEPSLALFVPDKDPLLFYRRIADLGCSMLAKDGMLFFEINRRFGKEVVKMLQEMGYRDVELRQDMFGNDRMVKAIKPQ